MIDRRKVYVYRIPNQKEYMAIACDCRIHQREGEREPELWFLDPPDHGHMIAGEILRETEDGFIFRSSGVFAGEWTFKELTMEYFRRKFCKFVDGGQAIAAAIRTTEDLHEWYRKEFHFPSK